MFPGLTLALLYILGRCIIRPQDGQRLPPDENDPPLARKLMITAVALVPPVILIFAVLGTILLGWATPTEAAAMGALGSDDGALCTWLTMFPYSSASPRPALLGMTGRVVRVPASRPSHHNQAIENTVG